MNHFEELGIEPTHDKMKIRRAWVEATKKHHPDVGGSPEKFERINQAYKFLIDQETPAPTIFSTSVKLHPKDLLTGCRATAIFNVNETYSKIIDFVVPEMTAPGTTLKFSTNDTIENSRVEILITAEPTLNHLFKNRTVTSRVTINKKEARDGKTITITNFDGKKHQIVIPPNTTAHQLIYKFQGEGFIDKSSFGRGDYIIEVTVRQGKKTHVKSKG